MMELNSTESAALDVSAREGALSRPAFTMINLTEPADTGNVMQMATIGALLTVLIMACIVGNLFVIVAILIERDLRSRPQYYLIFSLAVADLLVGLIVTPLGAWSTILRAWTLGVALCDFWISVDVLVCTSSILHLVAIALDRYWSVTDVCYVQNRTPRRIFSMLGMIWFVSLLISLAPMLGWKDGDFYRRVKEQHVCLISQQISYQVFSTATAFYIPLCAIICIYYKIMRAAKRRFKRERDRRTIISRPQNEHSNERKRKLLKLPTPVLVISRNTATATTPTNATTSTVIANGNSFRKTRLESSPDSMSDDEKTPMNTDPSSEKHHSATEIHLDDCDMEPDRRMNGRDQQSSVNSKTKRKGRSKENSEMKRERKAWRTLAIITGTFVACWTPFFLVSLYRPLCRCKIPILLESVTNWLGYLNSALNPIIYTVFSRDFRVAFKRILSRLLFLQGSQQRC